MNVIIPKLHTSVAYAKTACKIWENLRKRYSMANALKIHPLKTDLASCKQSGLEVVEFYSKLMGMWSELESFVKLPHCTRRKCKCSIGTKLVRMMDEEKTHQFLMGLDDDAFSNIRSQVLARDLLPSLDTVFNIIQQEENHKKTMIGRDQRSESVVAFAARDQANIIERPTCKHCGCYGHDKASCYEIIGYSQNWNGQGRGSGGCGRSN